MDNIYKLLRKIGMRSTYIGYDYLAYGIALTLSDVTYLKNVTKKLYADIGTHFGVPSYCVEAAMRTLITSYWNQNKDQVLRPLLGYPIYDRPSVREVIAMLADYLRDHPDVNTDAVSDVKKE